MSDNTKIEWTDATWNPITGCSVVSPGCTNCYAMHLAGTRLRNHPSRTGLTRESAGRHVWNGQVRLNEEWLQQPIQWKRPRRVFVCAHGDLFHESVPDEWITRVFAVMALSPQHTFQVLTKRAKRMFAFLIQRTREFEQDGLQSPIAEYMRRESRAAGHALPGNAPLYLYDNDDYWRTDPKHIQRTPGWPLRHVHLGVSVEDQQRADERIPYLLQTPASVRWLSCEPLLGPVDLERPRPGPDLDQGGAGKICQPWLIQSGIDWVVVGGESGHNARPMHPDWARSLRDQCAAAGVPFFFKQWGEWLPRSRCHHTFADGQSLADLDPGAEKWRSIRLTHSGGNGHELAAAEGGDDAYMQLVGKKFAGRLLDGVEHNGYPVTP